MSSDVRIGVFICKCGVDIANIIDVEVLREYVVKLPKVVYVGVHEFLCFDEGRRMLMNIIRKYRLNRVVVAACSPKLHEITFKRAVEEAGLNPFLLEIVDIREQCAWVHSNEPQKATEKAKHMLKAAVLRVALLEEIEELTVPIKPSVLIIGGGIAGITAALKLAEYGFHVYLVEKNGILGGRVLQLGAVFPTEDCGACMPPYVLERHRKCLYKYAQMVLTHPRISVLTKSTVENVEGYAGNFKVTIRKNPKYVDEKLCVACGICEEVCPVVVSNEFNLGLSARKAIYIPSPHAVPHTYVIDEKHCTKCGDCVKVCPFNAIDLNKTSQRLEIEVGAIIVATGAEEFSPKGMYGYGLYPDIITQLMLARMLDLSGPTKGEVVRLSDGRVPSRIVMIQCVGSRDPETNPYCSKICCAIALKHARSIKRLYPEAEITIVYKDIRLSGKDYESYYTDCEKLGVKFIKGEVSNVFQDLKSGLLKVELESFGKRMELTADLIVLSCGFIPSKDTGELSKILNISRRQDGFFASLHPKLAPINTNIDGIFICGACQGPMDISESITQALATASKVVALLAKGMLKADLAKAFVDEKYCIGCGVCTMVCPFSAVKITPQGVSQVIEIICKGCGICAAECPAGAMRLRNYKDEQIYATLRGVLESW